MAKIDDLKTENDIQKEIREFMQLHGWLVFRMNAGRRGGAQLCPAGTPDLLCLKNGRVLFIEVKRPGQKPSKVQKEFHELLMGNGFTVIVACDIDDLSEI